MPYASEEPLGIAAESLSLLLIIASFLVVTYLTYRTRNRKSFQFQMFLFAVVLVVAEVPRTLYSLGVLDLDWLSTVGLGIHSVSMVILTAFVALRINGFFRRGQVLGGNFEGIVQGAVDAGIMNTLGYSAMKSVSFYVRSGIAVTDPEAYARSLEKIFGSGTQVLMGGIMKSICDATNIQMQAGRSLPAVIESARQKFLASGTPVK